MGQRIVRISGDLLRNILLFPDDVKIVAMNTAMYFDSDELVLKLESPNFGNVKENHQLPTISAQYGVTEKDCGCRTPEFRGFFEPPPSKPSTYAALAMSLGFQTAEDFQAQADRAIDDFKAGKIDANTARAALGLPPLPEPAKIVTFREFI